MIYLLPVLFAFLNRARGSGAYGDWLSRFAKITLPVVIFLVCTTLKITQFIPLGLLIFGFLIGESLGWGKWFGILIDEKPNYDETEGYTTFTLFGKTIGFWDGIHHIANFIIKEKEDFKNYARVALFIRGMYWWFPVLAVLKFYGQINLVPGILSLIALGITFPLSFKLADFLKINIKLVENKWERVEIIYGFFQGLIFMLLCLP